MPALTVKAVTKALSDYVRPDEDIVAKLNMVMPRIYAMGMWRDLLYDWSIQTTNDYFALPEHAESLLGALIENSPVDMQSQWHDYRISGYASDGPAPIFGVVDDGFYPAKEDYKQSASKFYSILIRPSTASGFPESGEITVDFYVDNNGDDEYTDIEDYDSDPVSISFTAAAAGSFTPAEFTDDRNYKLKAISFSNISHPIRIYAENNADATERILLAEVKGDGVARYRRFRFSNSSGSSRNVKLLLKRAWEPVLTKDDIIYLGNLNAIKHGLLGMLAEDNADLERAQYHWTICRQLLDEELDAARGAVKPKPILKPVGNQINIPNII